MGNVNVLGAGTVTSVNGVTGPVQIGGRNYVRNSLDSWSDWTDIVPDKYNYSYQIGYIYPPDNMTAEDTLTLSMEIEFRGVTKSLLADGPFRIHFMVIRNGDWNYQGGLSTSFSEPPADGVYKISGTLSVSKLMFPTTRMPILVMVDWAGAGAFRVRKLMSENGSVSTDWRPAPEDILSRLEAIEAKLGITYDPPMVDGPEMEDMEMDNMTHAGGYRSLYIVTCLPALIGGVRHG